MNISIRSNIIDRLSPKLLSLVREIGYKAADSGKNLYLVGGIVRDLMLERAGMDIDIMVEGNALELISELEDIFPAKPVLYERFGTASFKFNGHRLDFSSCRSETYSRPGALPSVKPGMLLEDLFRRDFSINAMALCISPDRFGELVDPCDGLSDLAKKRIRILHGNSFLDDATRIMRAVRYEQRLGFRLEHKTLSLLKRDLDMLDTISSDRLRREVLLWLAEASPERIIRRAYGLSILSKLHPALRWNTSSGRVFSKLHHLSPEVSPQLYFCLLTYELDETALYELLLRINLTGTQYDRHSHQLLELKSKSDLLASPGISRAELYFLLRDFSTTAMQAFLLCIDSRRIAYRLKLHLSELRMVKPLLTGRHLSQMGVKDGPDMGSILHKLLEARLNGKVKTMQHEIELAKTLITALPEPGR